MKWAVVCLLVAGTAALAGDDARLAQVERDVASIDTNVRMEACLSAVFLRDEAARRRIFVALAGDPDPWVRVRALDCHVHWVTDREATAVVVSALGDPDRRIRDAALVAACDLCDEEIPWIRADGITALLPAAADTARDRD